MDYKKIGLKCGLEVHQQLDTEKLFSRTPSRLRDDKPDYTIERRLRPVASELGEMDKAALEAFEKGFSYLYEGHNDTVSLVELDEEPPQEPDKEAMRTVLEVALMSGSTVADEIFPMRKMVIDGSNTSGFQRTMLIATGGRISLKNRELGIQTLALEEDSARPVEKKPDSIVYRLDRLGIPLIELATEPGIKSPEEAREAALAIGTLFRRTCRAKRGLGTIRQDLNVSIAEGARIELKGIQELEIIDEYVRREVQRQLSLVGIKKELGKRGVSEGALKGTPKELPKAFENTQAKIIKKALGNRGTVMGLRLEGFKGLVGREVQPNRRLGSEFASYVKAKTGLKGIFHSDELPSHRISEEEMEKAGKELECGANDAFILVAAPREKAEKALKAVYERALQCLRGVPEETRGTTGQGNSEYLRPLPSAARMYPETDLESIVISRKTMKGLEKNLPLSVPEREGLYAKWGLNEKLVNEMKLSNHARFFERKVRENFDAKRLAVFLTEGLVEARRSGARVENLSERDLEEFVNAIHSGKITREIQTEVLIKKSLEPEKPLDAILEGTVSSRVDADEAEKIIAGIVNKNKKMAMEMGLKAVGPLMGDAMKELRGKISGKEISEILSREIRKVL